MTDRITCPECGGDKVQRIGGLSLRCQFCAGEGTVGDDNEPAGDEPRYNADGWKIPEEGDEYDPDIHGPLPAAGSHPAVTGSGLCPQCLGARVIVTIGGMREGYHGPIEAPCPACTAKGRQGPSTPPPGSPD